MAFAIRGRCFGSLRSPACNARRLELGGSHWAVAVVLVVAGVGAASCGTLIRWLDGCGAAASVGGLCGCVGRARS